MKRMKAHPGRLRHLALLAAALLAAALLAAALLAGCVGIQRNPDSALPGNSPASWEGRTLGVPVG